VVGSQTEGTHDCPVKHGLRGRSQTEALFDPNRRKTKLCRVEWWVQSIVRPHTKLELTNRATYLKLQLKGIRGSYASGKSAFEPFKAPVSAGFEKWV